MKLGVYLILSCICASFMLAETKKIPKCQCKTELMLMKQEIFYLRQALKPVEVNLFVRSEGCDDVGHAPGTCGLAFIKINGIDYAPKKRGHNIVVLNHDGSVWRNASFDTFGDPSSGINMNKFLLKLPYGRVVLVAAQDSANNYYKDAKQGLQLIGADMTKVIGYRDSWVLIGYKGERKAWVHQASNVRYKGPTEITRIIPVPNHAMI